MVQTYIGAALTRKEDVRFLTGSAKYLDDLKLPDMLHAAFVRSPHAHARIISVDISKALEIPGVLAVLTFEDIASIPTPIPMRLYPLSGLEPFLQYPLAKGKVRHVGEAVAVVIAESRYQAEDGLDAVEVSYEALPAVTGIRQAIQDQVILHEDQGTNQAAQYTVSIGDIDEAFRTAEYTRREVFKTHRHTGNPLETRGLLADYDSSSGHLTVWGPTKVPHFNRGVLASLLEIPAERIHFKETDVGGGFGIRGEFYPEDFVIPFAAIKLGKPVKWVEDRMEHLASANHSREVLCEIEVAAKNDGTLLGLRARVYGDMGGYVRTHGGLVPSATAAYLPGPYRIPAYQATVSCVFTNKMSAGTYRAPGHYESCFIRERLLDIVAADLKMDPAELRFKNLVQPEEMPYRVGKTRVDDRVTVYDSGNYPMALQQALEQIDYENLKTSQGRQADGRYHGIGFGCFVKNTGQGPVEGAKVVLESDQSVSVYLGITTLGQGHETTMAQICADGLGVPIDSITIYRGGTDYMPTGGGTFAGRVTVMAGSALYMAAQTLKNKLLEVAGGYLDIETTQLDLGNGQVYRKGQLELGSLLNLGDIVRLSEGAREVDSGLSNLEALEYFETNELTYAYGAQACHVAIDPETGQLEILRYVIVEDVGRCINPLIVHGQAVGAAAQGIGGTVLEELTYGDDGQLLAGSLMDYLLPTSTDVPEIESIILDEAPSPLNPLGVKGAGEGGIVATGAALSNAVSQALAPFEVQVTELPLSPNRIKDLIRGRSPRG